MSLTLYDEEVALAYEPPEDLPIDVLSVGYGEAIAAPDPIDTVRAEWVYRGRPGQFSSIVTWAETWPSRMDALLRLRVYDVERVYASLGGWPPPTPLPGAIIEPGQEIPGMPGVIYDPTDAGIVLPPGVIGIE